VLKFHQFDKNGLVLQCAITVGDNYTVIIKADCWVTVDFQVERSESSHNIQNVNVVGLLTILILRVWRNRLCGFTYDNQLITAVIY